MRTIARGEIGCGKNAFTDKSPSRHCPCDETAVRSSCVLTLICVCNTARSAGTRLVDRGCAAWFALATTAVRSPWWWPDPDAIIGVDIGEHAGSTPVRDQPVRIDVLYGSYMGATPCFRGVVVTIIRCRGSVRRALVSKERVSLGATTASTPKASAARNASS